MDKQPTSRKSSPARVILITIAALATICVVVGVATYAYFMVGTLSRMPKVSTQGTFENHTYTAPGKNFTCKFPWNNVEGETLTDNLEESSGWVKYRNDFGINIAVQYLPERDDFRWSETRQEQHQLLDSLFDSTVSNLRSQVQNFELIHSEHRDDPQPAFFSVSKYKMDQNDSSLVMRGDLFFFNSAYYYIITYAVYDWSPIYRNTQGEEWKWISTFDLELRKFSSECEFE